jgi:hypothetical protein
MRAEFRNRACRRGAGAPAGRRVILTPPLGGILLAILLCTTTFAEDAAVLRRVPAEGTWDVVARLAGAPAPPNGRFSWVPRQRLEVLFQDRSDPRQAVRIVSEPGPNDDCSARIERMTAATLVVSCVGEKWATYETHQFLYNPRARTLLRRVSYMPFGAVEAGPRGIVMGSVTGNAKEFLRIILDAAGKPRVGGPVPAPTEADPEARFGAFHIARQKNRYGSDHDVMAEGDKLYPLPQSDMATWKTTRPDDVKGYLHPDQAEMNEEIGPHQWVGGDLWFGKTFYNSEGATGVGGFGYFDSARRKYKLYAPPEIWRWSVSAIRVELDFVWLALYRRGEYGNYPGGLLRWDRRLGTPRQFPMDQIGATIARIAGVLCVAGTDGLVVLGGDVPTSYLVDRAADGDWEIAPRNRSQ